MTEINTNARKFLDGFRKWWQEQGHSIRSADSYCTGIRRVNKEFFFPLVHKDLFDVLDDAVKKDCAEDFLTALVGTVGERCRNTTDPTDKKRLQDTVSHLKKFIEYVAWLQDNAVASETVTVGEFTTPMPSINSTDADREYFERDTLVNIFARRIKTQDRMSAGKNIFFPIRILGQLFSTAGRYHSDTLFSKGIRTSNGKHIDFKKWYDSWVRGIVERVVFHTIEGDYALSDIEGLLIMRSTGSVWIVEKQKSRNIQLMSEGKSGLQPMSVTSLSGIHLDHTERMEDLLIRLEPVLPVMRKITDNIKESVKGKKVIKSDGATVEIDSYRPGTLTTLSGWYCDNVDWNFIAPLLSLVRVELDYIAAATHLTAMSSTDNLKKH